MTSGYTALSVVAVALITTTVGFGGYYAGAQSVDPGHEIGPNQTVVDKSEALSEKNGLVAARQGPAGNVSFACSNENCTVGVDVDDFNEFQMLYVSIYSDGETLESDYLHPGDAKVEYQDVTTNASMTIAVPIKDRTGYWWRKSYSLGWQSDYEENEVEYDALVTYAIVNEEYFFGGPPENETEDDSP